MIRIVSLALASILSFAAHASENFPLDVITQEEFDPCLFQAERAFHVKELLDEGYHWLDLSQAFRRSLGDTENPVIRRRQEEAFSSLLDSATWFEGTPRAFEREMRARCEPDPLDSHPLFSD